MQSIRYLFKSPENTHVYLLHNGTLYVFYVNFSFFGKFNQSRSLIIHFSKTTVSSVILIIFPSYYWKPLKTTITITLSESSESYFFLISQQKQGILRAGSTKVWNLSLGTKLQIENKNVFYHISLVEISVNRHQV